MKTYIATFKCLAFIIILVIHLYWTASPRLVEFNIGPVNSRLDKSNDLLNNNTSMCIYIFYELKQK